MRGRAHELLEELRAVCVERPFVLSWLTLRGRIKLSVITHELDDADLEERLHRALIAARAVFAPPSAATDAPPSSRPTPVSVRW